MIDRLVGRVVEMDPTHVILQTGGVGFHVAISLQTFDAIGGEKEISLYTHLYVRDDNFQLYGFSTKAEREVFQKLISISGVGPKAAQALLSSLNTSTLIDAISSDNWKRLTAAPGVGRKLAERIVVELRSKFKHIIADSGDGGSGTVYEGEAGNVYEAVEALVTLGYGQGQAEKLVAKAAKGMSEDASVEDLVRIALKMK